MEVRNPASGSIYREMKEFLGDKLYEKYINIRPLLALCIYRIRTYSGYGTYEMLFSTEETTTFLKLYRRCLYPFVYLKNLFTPSVKKADVMLSSTLYKSGRYNTLIKDISSRYSVLQTNASTDIPVFSSQYSIFSYIKTVFGFGYGKKIPSCSSITGKKLKKAVCRWMDFSVYMYENRQTCPDSLETADRLLSELEKEFEQRVSHICKKMESAPPRQYITINQYNLRDMVMITACRKLGIRTKQLEHHASRFMHNTADGESIYRFCFVDDICCWSKSEVDFHINIYRYETFFSDIPPEIYSVGNPEISMQQAENAIEQYPVQNRITFMVSGLLDKTDKVAVKKQLDFRNSIFQNLKKLSERTGVKILVRYPPGLDIDFRKKEEKALIDMGFEISPSDRASLYSDICGSCAVFGTISSVLGLAALMGKTVYQVTSDNENYYITDHNIHSVAPSDIPKCNLSVTCNDISESDFINYTRLLFR